MPNILKLKSEEQAITSNTNVNGARLVRIYAPEKSFITVYNMVEHSVIGSFTVPAGATEFVEKEPADVISANTTVYGTSVSFNI